MTVNSLLAFLSEMSHSAVEGAQSTLAAEREKAEADIQRFHQQLDDTNAVAEGLASELANVRGQVACLAAER